MPKIIENPEGRLVAEARRQAREGGYSAVTIRSVAEACGVGVGTVYNYYPCKDDLLAAFLLQDWKICVKRIQQAGEKADSVETVLQTIWQQLHLYLDDHASIFRDESAAAGFGSAVGKYHGLLRQQLTRPLERFYTDAFTAQFVAEAMLTWTVAGKPFEDLYSILKKL